MNYIFQQPYTYVCTVDLDLRLRKRGTTIAKVKRKMKVTNKYIVIKHHFEGAPKVSYFDFITETFALSV